MTEEVKKRIRVYPMENIAENLRIRAEFVNPSVMIGDIRKCEHGVFIPVTSDSVDHAPFCSLCYPFVKLKEEKEQWQEPTTPSTITS